MKHVIYIAGKYRASSEWGTIINIRNAERCAQDVWKAGMVAICPHLNTQFWGGMFNDDVFLDGYLELVSRCDAMLMVDGWRDSSGARHEHELAERLGIPIFYSITDLEVWHDNKNNLR